MKENLASDFKINNSMKNKSFYEIKYEVEEKGNWSKINYKQM